MQIYKRLGFTQEFDSLRLRGEFCGEKLPQSNISEKMVKDIAVFDQDYFGANRKILLENFFALSSVRLVEIDTTIKGYLFARNGSLTKVGPCVCKNEKRGYQKEYMPLVPQKRVNLMSSKI